MFRDPEKADGDNNNSSSTVHPHQPESIPPWVHAYDSAAQPAYFEPIVPNTRHYRLHHRSLIDQLGRQIQHPLPLPLPHHKRGRKWDHARSADPAMISEPITQHQQRWIPFMESGPAPHTDASRVVDQRWMEENMPLPWDQDAQDEAEKSSALTDRFDAFWIFSPERQQRTMAIFWRLMLKNPFVPLVFRVITLAFVCTALGLSVGIFQAINRANRAEEHRSCAKRASTWIAIIMDTIAIPYILYVTYDEYFSKPLGLRSAKAKIALLLLDLFFIIFASSNVSLAFDALTDPRWACYDDGNAFESCPRDSGICYRQKALSSVLVISLVFWAATFYVSVMRVVERLRI